MDDLVPVEGWLLLACLGIASAFIGCFLLARVPPIPVDPREDPADFPPPIGFAELAARPGARGAALALGLVAAAGLGLGQWPAPGAIAFAVALPWLIGLVIADYVTWFLPDRLLWPAGIAVVLALVCVAVADSNPWLLAHSAGGAIGLAVWYGVFWVVSPRSLAFGDVKLGVLLGLILGSAGPTVVLGSVALAGVVALASLLPMAWLGRARNQGDSTGVMRAHIPFGPAMIIGAWLALLMGRGIVGS